MVLKLVGNTEHGAHMSRKTDPIYGDFKFTTAVDLNKCLREAAKKSFL